MAHLKDLKSLGRLELAGTRVTDEALPHLCGLTSLRSLTLQSTRVTTEGVKKLAAALPQCKIEWDGGVIEPKEPAKK